MSPSLSVVADNPTSAQAGETVAERVRRLQAEARNLAREHIRAFEQQILTVERLAAEIAEGGEAYPVGVRDIARRLAEDLDVKVQTLEALVARSH